MKQLTVMDCEEVSGGLILAIVGCVLLGAAIVGAVYAGYKMESAGDECHT